MDNSKLLNSWNQALCDKDYMNVKENEALCNGESGRVFSPILCERIKLRYANGTYVNSIDDWTVPSVMAWSSKEKKLFTKQTIKVKDFIDKLVTNFNVCSVSTNILKELAMYQNEGLYTVEDESQKELMETLDKRLCLTEMFDNAFTGADSLGSVLLKAVKDENEEYHINMITPLNYFPVYNSKINTKIDAFVEYQKLDCEDDKEIYLLMIHEENKTTYKFVDKKEKLEDYVPTTEELYQVGLGDLDGLVDEYGFTDEYQGWAVVEVYTAKGTVNGRTKPFGRSSYTDGVKSAVRDIIVFTTEEGQDLDAQIRTKFVVDESFTEADNSDFTTAKINYENNFFVSNGMKENPKFDQIKKDLPTNAVKLVLDRNIKLVYEELGINETATGTSEKGYNSVSGKTIDMNRVLTKASKIKTAVAQSMEQIIKFILLNEFNVESEVTFDKTAYLTLTESETIANIVLKLENGLISDLEAIRQANGMDLATAEQMLEQIKLDQERKMIQVFDDTEETPIDNDE